MKLVTMVLTFLAAGACILAAACMVVVRLPAPATQRVLRLAARLLDSATRQARQRFGTGRLM